MKVPKQESCRCLCFKNTSGSFIGELGGSWKWDAGRLASKIAAVELLKDDRYLQDVTKRRGLRDIGVVDSKGLDEP